MTDSKRIYYCNKIINNQEFFIKEPNTIDLSTNLSLILYIKN